MARLSKQEFKAECNRRRDEGLDLAGNTYDIKDKIKARGGIWDSYARAWLMPDAEAFNDMAALMEGGAPKPEPASKPAPKAKPAPKNNGTWNVTRFGHHRPGRNDRVGTSFRDKHAGKVATVVKQRNEYVSEDGLSFGLPDDEGWVTYLTVREATAEEVAPIVEHEKKQEEGRAAVRRLEALKKLVRAGEKPELENGESIRIDAPERLVEGAAHRIYGGGTWFYVTDEHLWYVENNGSDGGMWAANNVRTGGAGAIGWRVAVTPELVAEVEALEAVFGSE